MSEPPPAYDPESERPTGPPPSLLESLAAHHPKSVWRRPENVEKLARMAGWRESTE
jgi:hypothetical protein